MSRSLIAAGLIATMSTVAAAQQHLSGKLVAPNAKQLEHDRAIALGKLDATLIDLDLDGATARDALRAVGKLCDIPMMMSWEGLDADREITLTIRETSGRAAIEAILACITDFAPTTWQIRPGGYLDVGTREQLARRRETRVYDVTDMLIEPPYFVSKSPRAATKMLDERDHKYLPAALGDPPPSHGTWRKDAQEILEEITEGIVETVEPGNWDQPEDPAPSPRIARLRVMNEQIFIDAPAFVHRQVDDQPLRFRPDPIDTNERMNREAAATRGGVIARIADDSAREFADPAVRRGHEAQRRGEIMAALNGTSFGRPLDGTAAECFSQLAEAIGVPVVIRSTADSVGYGIAADTPIAIDEEDAPTVRAALEAILRVCEKRGDRCTWQVRSGFIEVGTVERLAVPGARVQRIYDITDVSMDIPMDAGIRRYPFYVALDVVGEIVERVEPELWDWGQLPDDNRLWQNKPAPTQPAKPAARRKTARYRPPVMPATIRYFRRLLIVVAPDFIHRQVE